MSVGWKTTWRQCFAPEGFVILTPARQPPISKALSVGSNP
jgi:hypothetical protein